ncbi:hypothetical protein OS965_39740 [Streptomyces sp. H27-G5]|uniref:hypothetical protein n=1 Tax=Streptomyces sp. H27-G5 TaxID=2996698 RepID=UPI00226DC629|nr:hypothetical protein [Streptomyces sp. H27-G5]MCY0924173.1 hypothetical protein [Streptomyces sp. H27-G5]
MRRTDFDHIVRLGWLSPVGTAAVDYGRAYWGVVQVPLYSAAAVALLPQTRPHIDWRQIRRTGPGRRSPLAALQPAAPEADTAFLAEVARIAAMAYRLVMTITDAVRRATQKRITGREEELGEDAAKMAPGWSAEQLRGVLGEDILAELMAGPDWPQLARQLVGLQQAGVDLGTFLPQMGRMTAGVHQAVAANIARTKAEGTARWADLLRTAMPEGLVREAILAVRNRVKR